MATTSRSVYVGNLAFVTTDRQVYELFSRVGPVEQVIMGLNRITKQPCGFCFVMFVQQACLVLSCLVLFVRRHDVSVRGVRTCRVVSIVCCSLPAAFDGGRRCLRR